MSKTLLFHDEARRKLAEGVKTLYRAVSCTLGPKGRNVILQEGYYPHVTKDGVSIAKSVVLKDRFMNMGCELVKNASIKTCEDAGDGTTTSVVLANALINSGIKYLKEGHNPNDLNKGIDFAVKHVVDYIKSTALDVNDERIRQIATISANNDEEIGNLVADAFIRVTKNGVVSIESAKGSETTVEYVDGLQIDRGYMSPYFITDAEEMKCEMTNPYILCYKGKLNSLSEILFSLETAVQQGRPILLIVDDIDSMALETLVMNKVKNQLNLCVIKSPFDSEYFSNLCVMIGADPKEHSMGSADKVIVTKTNTSIINGHGDPEEMYNLTINMKDPVMLAKLTSGAAIIRVGAASEIEMLEKKDRIEDALCAVRAASEEGIVAGGGFTYLMGMLSIPVCTSHADQPGGDIVIEALDAPFKQICQNAGLDAEKLLKEVISKKVGFNAKTERFSDLIEDGVIDPAKVSRVALENAASVAKMFLTTECVIVENE